MLTWFAQQSIYCSFFSLLILLLTFIILIHLLFHLAEFLFFYLKVSSLIFVIPFNALYIIHSPTKYLMTVAVFIVKAGSPTYLEYAVKSLFH